MRTTGIIRMALAAAFAALVMSSCTKEENGVSGQDSRYIGFTLATENVLETKSFSSVQSAQTTELSEGSARIFITASRSVNADVPAVGSHATKGKELTKDDFADGFEMSMYSDEGDALYMNGTVDESNVSDSYWSFYDANGEKIMWPAEAESGEKSYSFLSCLGTVKTTSDTDLDYDKRTITYTGMDHKANATTDADNLEDLLVAYTPGVKHDHKKQNLVSLNFYHPLAAVQFKVSDVVKKITISSVRKSGSFVFKEVNPADQDDFKKAFEWTVPSSETNLVSYVQAVESDDMDKTTGLATYEFFLVPIDFSKENVQLTFDVADSDGEIHQITTMAKNLGVTSWDSGYRYTYTVDDTVGANVGISVDETFLNYVKTDVGVSNDKRSTVYVRMAIAGNWVTEAGKIFSAFKFDSKVKFNAGSGTNWVKGDDGYYYYLKPLAGYATTDPLIDSFKDESTTAEFGTIDMGVYHLVWKIVAQGVEYDPDKKYVTEAWEDVKVGESSLVDMLETE